MGPHLTEYLHGRVLLGIWYFDYFVLFLPLVLALLSMVGVAFSRWCSRRLRVHGGVPVRRLLDVLVCLFPRCALAASLSSSMFRRLRLDLRVLRRCLPRSSAVCGTWLDHVRHIRVEGLAMRWHGRGFAYLSARTLLRKCCPRTPARP